MELKEQIERKELNERNEQIERTEKPHKSERRRSKPKVPKESRQHTKKGKKKKDTEYYSAIGCSYKLSQIRVRQRVLYLMWRAVYDEAIRKTRVNNKP